MAAPPDPRGPVGRRARPSAPGSRRGPPAAARRRRSRRTCASSASYAAWSRTGGRASTTSPTTAARTSSTSSAMVGYGDPTRPSLLGVVESRRPTAGARPQRQQQQPAYAEPVPGRGLLGGREDLEPDGGALVDQRGVAAHLVAGAALDEGLLDGPEGPRASGRCADAGVGGHVGDGPRQRRTQRLLERLEVLAAAASRPVVAHDPEGRLQVLGHPGQVPRVAGHEHAGDRAQVPLEGVEQRLLPRRHARPGTRGRCWVRARS